MRNRYAATFMSFLLLLISACASLPDASPPNDPLVGCWHGEDFQPVTQRKEEWLMNRKPDGSFLIKFTAVERGTPLSTQTEEGRWTHKNGKYTTVTTKIAGEAVDASDPQYTDTYEVKSIGDNAMTYYHPKMNLTFTSKKVACTRGAT